MGVVTVETLIRSVNLSAAPTSSGEGRRAQDRINDLSAWVMKGINLSRLGLGEGLGESIHVLGRWVATCSATQTEPRDPSRPLPVYVCIICHMLS